MDFGCVNKRLNLFLQKRCCFLQKTFLFLSREEGSRPVERKPFK